MKNAIFKELLQVYHGGGVALSVPVPPLHRKEPLDFVRQVQEEWESKVRRGINTLCTERGIALAREVSELLFPKTVCVYTVQLKIMSQESEYVKYVHIGTAFIVW